MYTGTCISRYHFNKASIQLVRESECCLMSNDQFFSYIMARPCYILMRLWSCLLCIRPTCWVGFDSACSLKQQLLHSHTLFWFWANQSFLLLLSVACLVEKQQIPMLQYFVWPSKGSIQQSTVLEVSTLIITPTMWFHSMT